MNFNVIVADNIFIFRLNEILCGNLLTSGYTAAIAVNLDSSHFILETGK